VIKLNEDVAPPEVRKKESKERRKAQKEEEKAEKEIDVILL